jgi:hypothetical protein
VDVFCFNIPSREHPNQSAYILNEDLPLLDPQRKFPLAIMAFRVHGEEVEPARRMMQSATIVSCTRPPRPQFRASWGALSRFPQRHVSSAETTRKRRQVDLSH